MKKVFTLMAMAAALLAFSCKKNTPAKPDTPDPEDPETQTGLAIKIDGNFDDWAALKPEQVSVAKNDPNSPWDAVTEIRCCADADFVYYYVKYNKEVLAEQMENKEGLYFPQRYMVDCCHNGEYLKKYFDSYPEAIDWIQSEYGIDTDKFDSIQEVEAKVEAVNSFDDGDFFNFHRFETEYKYDAERGAA